MVLNAFRAVGATAAVVLMVTALWAWGGAWEMTAYATRPEVAAWAVRSGAIAAAAAAQLLVLTALARHRSADEFVPRRPGLAQMAIGVVGSIALVSAIALGLAGK